MNNLTICVPTYNRFPFLKWTLGKLQADFPDTPIVVSDNCSTDDTRTIQRLPNVRYLRQDENIGPFPNMRAALLEAKTPYAVYCADDDYLLREPLEKAISFLDQNPHIVAYYAPCELYDEVAQKPEWKAYPLTQRVHFTQARSVELFNFVISSHVWPEHVVWRTAALLAILTPRISPYWAFVDLGAALTHGDVHFSPDTFYRNIMAHPVGWRSKLGDRQCLTDFEEYRSGLEIMAHDLFSLWQSPPWPQDFCRKATQMIDFFIYQRIEVAHRIMKGNGFIEEAAIMAKRLAVTNPHAMPEIRATA